jgi:hypothetical protein
LNDVNAVIASDKTRGTCEGKAACFIVWLRDACSSGDAFAGAALEARALRGSLQTVLFRAVCLV